MFKRKKEIKNENNLQRQHALQLSKELDCAYDKLFYQVRNTYLMQESCKILIGADLEMELKRVEKEKETLRNYIANYDIQRKELNDYISKNQITWSVYPRDSHSVIRNAIKSLFE